jgi:hypothetical protein
MLGGEGLRNRIPASIAAGRGRRKGRTTQILATAAPGASGGAASR